MAIEASEKIGAVRIADDVVPVIAALAANEVEGVISIDNSQNELMSRMGVRKAPKGVKVDIIGRTVNVSFWMCHDYDEPLQVYLSAEQNDGSNTEYIHVLEGNVAADGKWVYFSGSYEVPETVKKIYFYFESENETASFYLDDITFDVVY